METSENSRRQSPGDMAGAGFCKLASRLGTITANATAQTMPARPYIAKINCQLQSASFKSDAVSVLAAAVPSIVELPSRPEAIAFCVSGIQAPMALAAQGKIPAWAMPIAVQMTTKLPKSRAWLTCAVNSDQIHAY